MSRALDDLCPLVRDEMVELIARATEARIPALILDTLRTEAEQRINLANGSSKTANSLHLPQTKCRECGPYGGKSHAIDIAPYKVYKLHGPDKLEWDADDPVWQRLGKIGKAIGLRWGGDFTNFFDGSHFESREGLEQ